MFLTAARTIHYEKSIRQKKGHMLLVPNSISEQKLKPIHGWGYFLIVETKLVTN
jgi:hypothetical protein